MVVINEEMSDKYVEKANIISAFDKVFKSSGYPVRITKPSFYMPDDAVSELADITRISALFSNVTNTDMNNAYDAGVISNAVSVEFIYKAIKMFGKLGIKPKDLVLATTGDRQPVYIKPRGDGEYSDYVIVIAALIGNNVFGR